MKSFVKNNNKIFIFSILLVGLLSFILLNNNYKSESKTIYKDGIIELDYNMVQIGDEFINGTSKVTFDAFFLDDRDGDGNAEKYRGKSINVEDNGKLWLELKVLGDVTLKNAYIEFQNTNARIEGALVKDNVIKSTIVSNNVTKIPLSEINIGTTKLFYVSVYPNLSNDINSYSGINKVILKGIAVENGQEIEIEKEIEYETNFYGTKNSILSSISTDDSKNKMFDFDANGNLTVTYKFKSTEYKDLMLLKNVNIEGTIGQLNGYDPIDVIIYSPDFEIIYDNDTRTFKGTKTATLENNIITTQAYSYRNMKMPRYGKDAFVIDNLGGLIKTNSGVYSDPSSVSLFKYYRMNDYEITIVYPSDAAYKSGSAGLNISVWHDCYNNEKVTESVTSSLKSNIFFSANYKGNETYGEKTTLFSNVDINKDGHFGVSHPVDSTSLVNKYRGIDGKNVTYYTRIAPYVHGYNPSYPVGEITISDMDHNDMQRTGLDNLNLKTYEKYNSIYLSNVFKYIGNSGSVKIIDNDTNEIIHIFNKDNINDTYYFDSDVRSVRLVISDLIDEEVAKAGTDVELFQVYLVKEMDNDYIVNNISNDDFIKWNTVETNIRTDWEAGDFSSKPLENDAFVGGKIVQNDIEAFTSPKSYLNLTVRNNDIRNRLEINISTNDSLNSYNKYENGEFLILIPDEIVDFNIVDSSSNQGTYRYEQFEQDGQKFIKVYMKDNEPTNYSLNIVIDAIFDIRKSNGSMIFEAYAYNPYCHNYLYSNSDMFDLNSNGDTLESIGYDTYTMDLILPAEVMTLEELTNYDSKNSKTVSPLIAEVDPTEGKEDATVNVFVLNNSGYAINNIKVLGKIAYIGNTSQIDNANLGSEFDVKMTSDGIEVPSELASMTKIYYSENDVVNENLDDLSNNWVEHPTDFSNIKTYLIVIDGYELANKESTTFKYNIKMPTTINNLNKTAYSTHAVYFDILTDEGAFSSNANSAKLGYTYTIKYDLNIKTYRIGTDKVINDVAYEVEDAEGNIRTISPRENGLAFLKGLYVGEIYKLRQVNISNNYILDEEEKSFEISIDSNDDLYYDASGQMRDINLTGDKKLNIDIENIPRYTLVIKNTDLDTDDDIAGSKFKVTGKGYESGYTTLTSRNGEITLKGLYLDEEYQIEQISVPEHQKIKDPFIIKLIYDEIDKKIKITKKYIPNDEIKFHILEGSSNALVNKMTYNTEFTRRDMVNFSSYSSGTSLVAYTEIDLENVSKDYSINVYSGYSPNLKAYLTSYLPDDISELDGKETSIANRILVSMNNVINEDGTVTSLEKGKKYYLIIKHDSGSAYLSLNISSSDNEVEYVKTNELSTIVDNNDKIRQTLNDNLDNPQPIERVKVQNPVIPTSTFKIVKRDADTNELLADAQYILEGPGIANNIILSTDENGEATAKIYINYAGDYKQIGLEYVDDADSFYTLKEVSAPAGYALDTREIKFKLNKMFICPTSGTCTADNIKSSYVVTYDEDEEFKNTEYDKDTNTLSVDVYDVPVVKIVKTDGETAELLPNTVFALYKLRMENGREILSIPYDADGKEIGEKVNIDGNECSLIKTNENGEISLNLAVGQYKLKEVQASSDKYELIDQEYYFGVGMSVPSHAIGVRYYGSRDLSAFMPRVNYYLVHYTRNRDTNGLIINDNEQIEKFDVDGNLQWRIPLRFNGINTDSPCMGKINLHFSYFDKTDTITEQTCVYFGTVNNVYTLDNDETFVNVNVSYDDKYKNVPLPTIATLKINGNGEVEFNSQYDINVRFTTIKDVSTSNQAYNYNKTDDESKTYATTNRYYINAFSAGEVIPSNDMLYIGKYYATNGIINDNNGGYIAIFEKYGSVRNQYVAKLSSNLELIEIKDITNNFREIIDDSYLTALNGVLIKDYESDDFFIKYKYARGHGSMAILARFDQNLNMKYVTPLGVIENNKTLTGDAYTGIIDTSDGFGAFVTPNNTYGTMTYAINVDDYKNEFNGVLDRFGTNRFVLEYDDSGKTKNVVNYFRKQYDYEFTDTNKYIVKDNTNFFRVIYDESDNSYIVAAKYVKPSDDVYTLYLNPTFVNPDKENSNKVVLASGKEVTITGNFIIYKVNKDSRVEWISQFEIDENIEDTQHSNLEDDMYLYKDIDNKIKLFLPNGATYLKDLDGNYLFGDDTGNENANLLIFEPSTDVTPDGPEAYTLNIENRTKEYKVRVISDEGANVSIKNKYDVEIFNGNGETLSEIVKYNENSVNDITITLNPNYVLTSVKVNGYDLSYQVNDDKTITLYKIPNIIEDKLIEIKTKQGLSSVTVHHYLENTTERIASDEVISGFEGSEYETRPVISDLYTLITDENGEYIIPDNYKGIYQTDNDDVIYYYNENDAELNVKHYIDNTEIEIAPEYIERKPLGSEYETSPANVEFYSLKRVMGDERGTLNQPRTEVVYFYQANTEATIKVKHLDINTNESVAPDEEFTVQKNDYYETSISSLIPSNYKFISKTDNAKGYAEKELIEVTYYYDLKPFNVSVDKKIKSITINGTEVELSNNKSAKIEPKASDEVIIYYEMFIKNNQDIKADFKVVEPKIANLDIYELNEFKKENNEYVLNTSLEPGEEKTYIIAYRWNNGFYGTSKNIVELTDISNEYNTPETNLLDNMSDAEVVITLPYDNPKTADNLIIYLVFIIISIVSFAGTILYIVRKKRTN